MFTYCKGKASACLARRKDVRNEWIVLAPAFRT